MTARGKGAMALVGVLAVGVLTHHRSAPPDPYFAPAQTEATPQVAIESVPTTAPVPAHTRAAPLLRVAPGGDGDSWHDTHGREYRLGLVNTPEYDECYGSVATAKRKKLVANGFRAAVYTTDVHGRSVAVVSTASGLNVNIYLARYGYANDKYLAEFRHENPALASKLDVAFAEAKAEHRGLWGACRPAAPQGIASVPKPASSCHPDYVTCIPIKGDGSGNGEENDLDCGDIRQRVQLREVGRDPYRLDANGDGFGCESYG